MQPPLLAPPPRPYGNASSNARTNHQSAPVAKSQTVVDDPFGMGDFGSNGLESAIGLIDKRILEMKVRFQNSYFIN